jgi:hypothetical protein
MSEGSARLALPAARFLPTVTSDTRADFWICYGCSDNGEAHGSRESAPRVHMAETGHETEIIISHRVTIEGVRY